MKSAKALNSIGNIEVLFFGWLSMIMEGEEQRNSEEDQVQDETVVSNSDSTSLNLVLFVY